ncbi:MAG: phytanoyl-CoA dioxygenase family protein [Cyanobacteria bacterium P01_G01_bin.67]
MPNVPNPIDTQEALLQLGVNQNLLTSEEISFLDRNGYLMLPNILSQEQVTIFRQRLDQLSKLEGHSAGAVDQTKYQLRVNREDLKFWERIAAYAYNLLFHLVRLVALRWLFTYKPGLKSTLRARSGSPKFGSPQLGGSRQQQSHNIFDWFKIEIREMLAAAAFTEAGAVRVCNLLNKDPMFDVCFKHPRVLAAVQHLLGNDFKVSSVNYRAAKPGGGLQPLHSDWEKAVAPGNYIACNTLWILDDFTENNGATRVVPGSHLSSKIPSEVIDNCLVPYPEQSLILAPAGTVIIMNSHTWHGGTVNYTNQLRRIIQSYFVQRDQVPQLNQREYAGEQIQQRLTVVEKLILDID